MTPCGGFDDNDDNKNYDAHNDDDDYKSYDVFNDDDDVDFAGEPPLEPTPCGGFYQCPNGTVCEYVFIIIIEIIIIGIISTSIPTALSASMLSSSSSLRLSSATFIIIIHDCHNNNDDHCDVQALLGGPSVGHHQF